MSIHQIFKAAIQRTLLGNVKQVEGRHHYLSVPHLFTRYSPCMLLSKVGGEVMILELIIQGHVPRVCPPRLGLSYLHKPDRSRRPLSC